MICRVAEGGDGKSLPFQGELEDRVTAVAAVAQLALVDVVGPVAHAAEGGGLGREERPGVAGQALDSAVFVQQREIRLGVIERRLLPRPFSDGS